MLYGRYFILLIDHKPLVAIFGSNKRVTVYSIRRLQWWATILLGYEFELRGQADALSRLTGAQQQPEEDMAVASISVKEENS